MLKASLPTEAGYAYFNDPSTTAFQSGNSNTYRVGFVDQLGAFRRALVLVLVRVVLQHLPPEGLLDGLGVGRHAQDHVVPDVLPHDGLRNIIDDLFASIVLK